MRIVVTADLHFAPHQLDVHRAFAGRLASILPDVLIIAGDIGEPLDLFSSALEVYASVSQTRAATAGNHDVWHRALSHTSQDLWDYKLEEVAGQHGYCWLERETLSLGGVGICGTVAWYDYSGKVPGLLANDDEIKTLKSAFNNDGHYIDWEWADPVFARIVSNECIARLDQLHDAEDISAILLVTHIPIFPQCQGKPGVMSAYSANLALGERVTEYAKLRAVISGHTHVERFAEITRGSLKPILAATIPSQDGYPAGVVIDTDLWQISAV